jgi:soluble lytic murein transglycosylase
MVLRRDLSHHKERISVIFRAKRIILLLLVMMCLLTASLGYLYWRTARFDGMIREIAAQHRLDFQLVKALIYEESWFDPDARGQNGEIGLMQVTPIVEQEFRQMQINSGPQKADLSQPAANLHVGCWYLRQSLDIFKNYRISTMLALARYNAGESRVKLWIRQALNGRVQMDELNESMFLSAIDIPSTRDYVTRILKRYRNRYIAWL